ncbi:MAG: pseudouridine synthase [Flavobacterium sp.]|nr:pseudouridine synthase [Flavobacterium sp.]
MNKNEGNNRRTGSSRPSSNKPTRGGAERSGAKPAMAKRAQGPKKAKPTTEKAAEPVSDKPAKKPNQAPKRAKASDEMRLNKYISNSGVCSRRDADIYIQSGNVKVNGIPVTEMGYLVKITDVVNFDGVTLTPEKKEYILLNKPKNFTTAFDEGQEQRNVLELVRGATNAKIASVGRMDKNTTGLLLFTNDTDMIRKFSLPSQKSSKIYQVSLDKNLKFEDLEKISGGVTIDNHRIFIEEISYIEDQPKSEVGLKLKTSNVKVVRNIFEHFKYDVLRIDRVAFAGLTKKNLPRGNWRFLTEQEIINLKNA